MDHIGRYSIAREIGRGGMGVVYEAVDPVLKRHLAIKLIRTDSEGTGRERNERLVHEARSAAPLSHPNIVTIYDVGLHEGNLYVVMEMINGASLRQALQEKTISREEFVDRVLPQIADALDHAHSNRIVHRDVKPSNIMMRDGRIPCLVDFGMADLLVGDKTQPGIPGGTIAYVAPEQIRGESLDGRADQFSLAVVAYEFITGALPFGALLSTLEGAFPLPSERDPTLPKELDAVFARALFKDPAGRYPTCAEFASAVRRAMRAADESVGATAIQPVPPPPAAMRVPPPASPPPPSPQPAPPPATASAGEFTRMFRDLQSGAAPKPSGAQGGEFTQMFQNLEARPAPTGFLTQSVFTQIVSGEKVKFDKIEGTLRFYRDRLSKQYDRLERQAHITYILWICCVGLGFAALIGALVFVILGRVPQGVATLVSSVVVYFIQRIFQQREDQYRKAADQKNEHLEYGNRWLLAIQTIESVEDSASRAKCQARLAYELTKKLGEAGSEAPAKQRRQTAK